MNNSSNLKILTGIFSTVLIVLLVSFFINTKDTNNSAIKKIILTSFYPIYITTINITEGAKGVEVVNLTKPQTGCLHDYSLTPQDLEKLQTASIFVINGANMESFINKVIKDVPKTKIIDSSIGLTPITNGSNSEPNPHFWLSIPNNIIQVQNISSQLAKLDPTNAKIYKKNADDYIQKLKKLNSQMHTELDNLKNKNIITFHEAFPYFAKEYNLNIVAVIEREPGSEPSAKELNDTIDLIKQHKVNALFAEPQYPAKAAQIIAQETGISLYNLDPVVTGSQNPNAYINTMEKNLQILKKALK